LVENNGYGLSTPSEDQFRCLNIADKGVGYGIESKTIDGNNILEVYTEVSAIANELRQNPRPFLWSVKPLECAGTKRQAAPSMYQRS
jgi:Pyruvate/2-oxoglutarate dehydrogenase complex, dehydrogenase (E1) component, eukaryotic type, alpha subunit